MTQPRVSLAVFAYNQERVVSKAVKSAIAQTADNIQIVIIDDHSTDSTFEVIEQTVRTNPSKHRLSLVRGRQNRGVLTRLLHVSRHLDTDYIAVCAGDDESTPGRCAQIQEIARNTPADIILHGVQSVSKGRSLGSTRQTRISLLTGEKIDSWLGAAAVYRKDFLDSLPIPDERVDHEDVALAHAAELMNKTIHESPCELLLYDDHRSSMPTHRGIERITASAAERIRTYRKHSLSRIQIIKFLRKLTRAQASLKLISDAELECYLQKLGAAESAFTAMKEFTDAATFRERTNALLHMNARGRAALSPLRHGTGFYVIRTVVDRFLAKLLAAVSPRRARQSRWRDPWEE